MRKAPWRCRAASSTEVGSYSDDGRSGGAGPRRRDSQGGFYISHMRDEADKAFEAMREVITIAEQAKLPVQNTHIKLGTAGVWGKAAEALGCLTRRAPGGWT